MIIMMMMMIMMVMMMMRTMVVIMIWLFGERLDFFSLMMWHFVFFMPSQT